MNKCVNIVFILLYSDSLFEGRNVYVQICKIKNKLCFICFGSAWTFWAHIRCLGLFFERANSFLFLVERLKCITSLPSCECGTSCHVKMSSLFLALHHQATGAYVQLLQQSSPIWVNLFFFFFSRFVLVWPCDRLPTSPGCTPPSPNSSRDRLL